MSVRLQQQAQNGAIYFITFTCFRWKPLIHITNTYDAVYKWFDYLSGKGAAVTGYVIMPNHIHLLVYLPPRYKTPNAVVSNAKRFLAYEIIKRLEAAGNEPLLQELHGAVKPREAKKGQIHKVFEESFDCKECYSPPFIVQKLVYMHHNPVKGKWNLLDDFALYPHSSAGFYHGTGAHVYKQLVRYRISGRRQLPGSRHKPGHMAICEDPGRTVFVNCNTKIILPLPPSPALTNPPARGAFLPS